MLDRNVKDNVHDHAWIIDKFHIELIKNLNSGTQMKTIVLCKKNWDGLTIVP